MRNNKKKRLSFTDRIMMIFSVILIVASICSIGYMSIMNWKPLSEYDEHGNIATIDSDIQNSANIRKKVTNFLITGIDYAEGTGRGKLTDVTMIVSFNMVNGEINVLQIPRDTYIGSEYPTGKINAVYGNKNKGGVENLARVIYDRFRLPIDHYVTINMDGFVTLVDAIGGVEIDVKESFTLEGVTFRPGLQTLDGIRAEKFVRERYSRGGDIGRINSQREFMAALIKKLKNLSVRELSSLAPTLMRNITTDMNVKTILTFAEKAKKLDMANIKFFMAPGESASINTYSVWTIHKEVLAQILNENFRPFTDPVAAETLNIIEVRNTISHYDNNSATIGDILGETT